jgi:UDP-3-O-[3-hydroxymyristoyl] glucosamine N-acyltransferase LpxD
VLRATLHEQEVRDAVGAPGPGDLAFDGLAPLGSEADRCVYWCERRPPERHLQRLADREGCAVLVPRGADFAGALGSCRPLEVEDPRAALAAVLRFAAAQDRVVPWVGEPSVAAGARISPLAFVGDRVRIDDDVEIGPLCSVGPDAQIGRGTILAPGARVLSRVTIGEHCRIDANAVLGAEGFGYLRDHSGRKTRLPQLGGVVVGSHVEIGSNSVLESGAIAPTTVEDHVKIGHLNLIGHACRVRADTSVAAHVTVGGSADVGPDAWIGIGAQIRDGVRVGARALIGMNASVQSDVPDDAVARAPRPEVDERARGVDAGRVGFRLT